MEMPLKKDTCPKCLRRVTGRQDALQCDACGLWLHRTCGTDISKAAYREITRQIKSGIPFEWVCDSCSDAVRQPVTESTRIDDDNVNATDDK